MRSFAKKMNKMFAAPSAEEQAKKRAQHAKILKSLSTSKYHPLTYEAARKSRPNITKAEVDAYNARHKAKHEKDRQERQARLKSGDY